MSGSHRIRGLQREVVLLLLRQQEVSKGGGNFAPLLGVEVGEDIRHRGARLGPGGMSDELGEVRRIYPGSNLREAWCLFGFSGEGRIALVTGDAIQLLDENVTLELGVEPARNEAGNDRLRDGKWSTAEGQQAKRSDEPGEFRHGGMLVSRERIPTLFCGDVSPLNRVPSALEGEGRSAQGDDSILAWPPLPVRTCSSFSSWWGTS